MKVINTGNNLSLVGVDEASPIKEK